MADKFTWSNMPVHCPVSQGWGENPEIYNNPPGNIPPTPGHNGVDFGCPSFTPGQVVDECKIDKIGNEPGGFGLYIRGWHERYKIWFYYAHLASVNIAAGKTAVPGDTIYHTGDSGWATGPHLHLGAKVNPGHKDYSAAWRGWVNPLAYYVPSIVSPPTYPPPVQPPAPAAPGAVSGVMPLPILPGKYRVINPSGLNIRSTPGAFSPANIVGGLDYGDVIEAVSLAGDCFVKLAGEQQLFCAITHGGVIYLEFVG